MKVITDLFEHDNYLQQLIENTGKAFVIDTTGVSDRINTANTILKAICIATIKYNHNHNIDYIKTKKQIKELLTKFIEDNSISFDVDNIYKELLQVLNKTYNKQLVFEHILEGELKELIKDGMVLNKRVIKLIENKLK